MSMINHGLMIHSYVFLYKCLINSCNINSSSSVLYALNFLKLCCGKIVLGCVVKLTFKYICFTKNIITSV